MPQTPLAPWITRLHHVRAQHRGQHRAGLAGLAPPGSAGFAAPIPAGTGALSPLVMPIPADVGCSWPAASIKTPLSVPRAGLRAGLASDGIAGKRWGHGVTLPGWLG